MAWLLRISCILLCCPALLQGKASEYQLDSETLSQCESLRGVAVAKQQDHIPHCAEDGRFRPVQCSGRSQECWCVDAEGQEVAGTRTNSSAPHCPTACQLQSLLRCSASGQFEEVQCESSRGQCWCVDQDGMELYGTRQNGRPARCPGSCEVRTRRLLHTSMSPPPPPPQCDEGGSFLPVQCKFINTTNRAELDLLHAFNRFPEAFETFSSFRKFFPLLSSYCFCSDSRGREMENTGMELLLSEVYDSAFSGLRSGRSFAQTNIYRVLQRRMLGVRLALTGHFRCPSPCEEERRAAMAASSVFVPSCESDGSFTSTQCQQGGQCWCVDPTGRELPGTRQFGDSLVCRSGPVDCLSQRRLALSRLFSGPVEPPLQTSSDRSPASCLSLLRPLRNILPAEMDPTSFLSSLVQVLHGLLPSVGGALQALTRSSPQRLQENLFGGKFLKSAAAFNFSGSVGAQGALGLGQLSSQTTVLQKNRDLVQSVSRALEDATFLSALQNTLMGLSSSQSASLQQVLTPLLRSCSGDQEGEGSIFVPSCTSSGGFQDIQCGGAECWCVDSQGQEVTGSRTAGRRPRCPTHCEKARELALRVRSNMAAGAEIHIPACSEDGNFLPLQCVGSRCFCVDAEGKTMIGGPTGGAVTCSEKMTQNLQSSAGRCSQALAEVTAFRQEVKNIIALSNSSHLPLGYGFLLAEGLRLTSEELQISQSEEELRLSDRLLSRSKAALRLAAFSTVQMLLPPRRRTYQMFTPQCDADGRWMVTQCYHSTGQCWCVDEDGEYIPDSLTSRSVHLPRCLTRCQRADAHYLLSGWMKGITATSAYLPQCEQDGRFSVLQTGGAAGWCVNPQTGETIRAASQNAAGQLTCPSWCELQGLQCRPDGSFAPLQCDAATCWCVSEDGQEVGGTRTPRQAGRSPSCDRPLCPTPVITHGALLCRPAANGRQSCDLICHHGYQNSLGISSFQCETATQQWDDGPLSSACQISQPLQSVSSSQLWLLSSSCSQISSLQSQLFSMMTSRGLCSAQLPVSRRSVSLCDDSSLSLRCDADDSLRLTLTWTAAMSDLPTADLPDLHDIGVFLNESRLLEGVQGILGNVRSMLTSEPTLVSMTTPNFGCSRGYRLSSDGDGCVVCPAGSFSREGACLLCPQGTYQDEEGRDFCNRCPSGSSPAGASSVDLCMTECQGRGLRCSQRGDFLPAQPDLQSGRWRCFSSEGAELKWTSSDATLTDAECSVLRKFEEVPRSDLTVGAEDAEVLQTMTSDLTTCIQACAVEPSCHHVALFNRQTQCELYSTNTVNTHCNASQQSSGFLGDLQAEHFDGLSCSLRVRGGASDLLVIRKKGMEFSSRQRQQSFVRMRMMKALSGVFRTQVFSSRRSSLSDVHRFCQDGCSRDACCDGFILNQNALDGGTLLCGWLRAPSVLMCGEQDWDVIGQGVASRMCGAGLTYKKEQGNFVFDFGGQKFTISGSEVVCLALISLGVQTCSDADSTSWMTQDCRPSAVKTSPEPFGWYQKPVNQWSSSPALCPPFNLPPTKNNVSMDEWRLLSDSSVAIDPSLATYDVIHVSRDIATNRDKTRDWCLHACHQAESCAAVSLREAESATRCVLYPDTTACGLSSAPALSLTCIFVSSERLPSVTSVSIPGHGILRGIAMETALGSDRRTVVQFLGVPYARPPIGSLRFEAAQPADWLGTWDATKPRSSCVQPGDVESAASSEDCLYLNIFTPAALVILVFFFNPSANQSPGLLDGSVLAAVGNIIVVTASYRTAALGFLSTGASGLRGNYGLSDQEAVLRWVHAHISLVGGDNTRVTVGAERGGADITSLHLLSSSPPLFQRMMLMGGSVFSPVLIQTPSTSRRQAIDLAAELGCPTSDDDKMASCLRAVPMQQLNTAQTKLLAVRGPFQSWSPVRQSVSQPASFHRVDLLLGTSEHDGLISRARRIKDFEVLQGRADGKTAFYEALSRSLGGASGNPLLKEAATWFYSLDHSPSAAGYNLFSRALNNATRDLFIICPTLQMASHWAKSNANVFLFHQPDSSAHSRADVSVPLDVQFVFGAPHHPLSSQRFSSSDRRLSLAVMSYASSFIQSGSDSKPRSSSALGGFHTVPPTYLELSPALQHQEGLSQNACSFWRQLGTRLTSSTGERVLLDQNISVFKYPVYHFSSN
uniref:Thyroglobulin n=1 Tax=Amphiprion ocellaris TaxID=80972 RepID=A0AAQ5Y3C9_AMPOC